MKSVCKNEKCEREFLPNPLAHRKPVFCCPECRWQKNTRDGYRRKHPTDARRFPRSLEVKEKIAVKLRGRKLTVEHRAKISAWLTGRTLKRSTREKLSTAMREIKARKRLLTTVRANPWAQLMVAA